MSAPAVDSLLDNAKSLESGEVTILQYLASGSPSSVVEIAARTYELPSRINSSLDHLSQLGFVEVDTSDAAVFRISRGGQAALSLQYLFETGEDRKP